MKGFIRIGDSVYGAAELGEIKQLRLAIATGDNDADLDCTMSGITLDIVVKYVNRKK